MLKTIFTALVLVATLFIPSVDAKKRACPSDEEGKMIRQCGGYVVWINRGKDGCTYGFKGDRFYCNTKSGYLACEQSTLRLGCRRPLNDR